MCSSLHTLRQAHFPLWVTVTLWTKAGFVLVTFAHPWSPFASAHEYTVVVYKFVNDKLSHSIKIYCTPLHLCSPFPMDKKIQLNETEVCSTVRVVSQVTVAAWSHTMLKEGFWEDRHSLWFVCTTEAYTEKSVSSIELDKLSKDTAFHPQGLLTLEKGLLVICVLLLRLVALSCI